MNNIKDFVVTSKVKNLIYFDAVNSNFIVPYHKIKYLFKKPRINNFSEIIKIKLLELEDENYCANLELMIKLEDNTKYYIKLIDKPTSKRSFKYNRAYRNAEKIIDYLQLIQEVNEYRKSHIKEISPKLKLVAE